MEKHVGWEREEETEEEAKDSGIDLEGCCVEVKEVKEKLRNREKGKVM